MRAGMAAQGIGAGGHALRHTQIGAHVAAIHALAHLVDVVVVKAVHTPVRRLGAPLSPAAAATPTEPKKK